MTTLLVARHLETAFSQAGLQLTAEKPRLDKELRESTGSSKAGVNERDEQQEVAHCRNDDFGIAQSRKQECRSDVQTRGFENLTLIDPWYGERYGLLRIYIQPEFHLGRA